jgi:hypothetical protein
MLLPLVPQSPLGNKLMGNIVGFTFEINGTKYLKIIDFIILWQTTK